MTTPDANAPTSPPEALGTPVKADKLAPFRSLFGLPVAVQFAAQTPYIQVAPLTDERGVPLTATVPDTGDVIGLPAVVTLDVQGKLQEQLTAVAIGVLHPSRDGSWLIIEERIAIPRTAESPAGQALMDVYVRPELVTHISFVKQVTTARRSPRDDA